MSKGNRKKSNSGLSPKDLELYMQARREGKALSFAKGLPTIVELPPNNLYRYNKPSEYHRNNKSDLSKVSLNTDTVEFENGTLLDPVNDLIYMVEALELYAAQCSDELSQVEHCREDCTHELEPKNYGKDESLDDMRLLAIGKKLQLISEERRDIKNRFEVVKLIKRAFESKSGQDVLKFLNSILADVSRLRIEQSQRVYTPRTDILDDLYGYRLPKYAQPVVPARVIEETDDLDIFADDEESCPPDWLEKLIGDIPEYAAEEPFIDEPSDAVEYSR